MQVKKQESIRQASIEAEAKEKDRNVSGTFRMTVSKQPRPAEDTHKVELQKALKYKANSIHFDTMGTVINGSLILSLNL